MGPVGTGDWGLGLGLDKIDVHDLLEAVLTSKVALMACFSQDSHVNTWDMVLKAILSHLGHAHTIS